MAEIKRFSLQWEWMKEDKQGPFVLFKEHKEIVDKLEKELEEARERYVQLWTRSNYR